jgi:hypothetical protein
MMPDRIAGNAGVRTSFTKLRFTATRFWCGQLQVLLIVPDWIAWLQSFAEGSTAMTRLRLTCLGLAVLAGLGGAAQARSGIEAVDVVIDYAKVVRLPEKVQTIIIGNPAIADVTVQPNGILVVTGKNFGVTNLIALDSSGAMLAETQIRVGSSRQDVVAVQRGMDRESYACAPACEPTPRLGDAGKHFGSALDQASARRKAALNIDTKEKED